MAAASFRERARRARARGPRAPVFLLAATLAQAAQPAQARAASDLVAASAASPSEPGERGLHYDWETGLPLLASGLLATKLPTLLHPQPPACRWCDAGQPNALDRWGRKARWRDTCRAQGFSDLGLGLTGVAALGPAAYASRGKEWAVNLGTIADSAAATGVLVQVTKYLARRERPAAKGCGSAGDEHDRNLSFFSGHAALAFSVAVSAGVVASDRGYRREPWVWAAGLPLAALTGYLRMAGDRHNLTDVVAGAAIGSLVGVWVPRHLHRDDRAAPRAASSRAPSAPALAPPVGFATALSAAGRSVELQAGPRPGTGGFAISLAW